MINDKSTFSLTDVLGVLMSGCVSDEWTSRD